MRIRYAGLVVALAAAAFAGALLDGDDEGARLALAQPRNGARDAAEETIIRVAREATPSIVSVTSRAGEGSGVVVTTDGVILTNRHVVHGTSPQPISATVEIGLPDGRRATGRVLGSDRTLDIAVVRIDMPGLTAAPIGDSDRLLVGQTAVAIGNPVGLDRTVTTGIISAVNRSPQGFELGGLIQTDAAINPGNSGGGLFDSNGRLIGINTAILRGTTGLGFAIPINLARSLAEQVVATGRMVRPYLGVGIAAEINPDAARRAGIDLQAGVVVGDVDPQSPAGRAGIREFDIITHLDGMPIPTNGELLRILRSKQPGETVRITLRSLNRQGEPGPARTAQVRLAEAEVLP